VSSSSGRSLYPAIDLDTLNYRHLVWQEAGEIYWYCLDEGGPENISASPGISILPAVVADSSNRLHVVWQEVVGPNSSFIYYRSFYQGRWGDVFNLTPSVSPSPVLSGYPSIGVFADGFVHVIWESYIEGLETSYLIVDRYFDGHDWSAPEVLASHLYPLCHPSLDYSHGADFLSAAWQDSSSGNFEAFFYKGNPGGGYPTPGNSLYPVVSTVGEIWSYLYWEDDSWGYPDICCHLYYMMTGWSDPQTLRERFEIDEAVRSPNVSDAYLVWTQGDGPTYKVIFLDEGYPIGVEEPEGLTASISFIRIQPNPFKNEASISYSLAHPDRVSLCIYDLSGRVVRDFTKALSPEPGLYTVVWDGCDDHGRTLPSGIYFCQLRTSKETSVHPVIVMR
jgi:hypothetical protein